MSLNIRDFFQQMRNLAAEVKAMQPDLTALASDPNAQSVMAAAKTAEAAVLAVVVDLESGNVAQAITDASQIYSAVSSVMTAAEALPSDPVVQKITADFTTIEATIKTAIGDL